MRLQRNEKPDDWPADLLNKIYATAPAHMLQRYPDPAAFYEKLSDFVGVPADNIVATSGIDESIRSLLTLCCNRGDHYGAVVPGYAMYSVYGDILGAALAPLSFAPDMHAGPSEIMRQLPEDAKILFLPNPGQPVENCLSVTEIDEIVGECGKRDTLVAIDEAYYHFGAPTAVPLIERHENLLILRTFSKAFGAASLRLGYAIGNETAIAHLRGFRLAHEANSFALHAGTVLLDCFESHVLPSVEQICKGRDFLRDACRARGFNAWGKFSNNVLIELKSEAERRRVVDALKTDGIYVKDGFASPLDRHILVTCGPKDLMESFFDRFVAIADAPAPQTTPA